MKTTATATDKTTDKTTDDESENSYRVPALERGLSIIEMFSAAERTLSMAEIAMRLGLTQSTIYRIMQTLAERGYLRKIAKTTFELGPRVVSAGFTWLASRDITEIAMPWLNVLRDRTSLSCHLAIREHTDAVYIYRAFAQQRLTVNIPIGSRLPCHGSALGRVLLADLSEDELHALYRDIRLDDCPPPAPKTFPELLSVLQNDRENGWAVSRSDDSTAIAAPILDHRGRVVAAANLSGPDATMQAAGAIGRSRELLLECTKAISAELGLEPQRTGARARPLHSAS
ncbi:MAG: IclR family transcriptional regulator [Azoarcus sp.]|nr:IclR family transcriptional regulator [Azoarcus sp.]